jgi:predicted PurR-regulated permease PerM
MLVVAAILAYLIDPLIVFIDKRTSIRRGIVIAIVYIILAAALIGGFFALGVASYQQAANLIEELPALIENVAASIAALVNRTEPITLGPLSLDPSVVAWDRLPEQLLGLVEPLLSQSGSVVSRFATSTVRTVFNLFFIFVLSIYLATDLPRFGGYVKSFAHSPAIVRTLNG